MIKKSMVTVLFSLLFLFSANCKQLQPPAEKPAVNEGLLWLSAFVLYYEPDSENPLMGYTREACDGSSSYPESLAYQISGYGYQGGAFSTNLEKPETISLANDSLMSAYSGVQAQRRVGTSPDDWSSSEFSSFMNGFLGSHAWETPAYCGNLDYTELGRLSRHRAQVTATHHLRKVRGIVDTEYAKVSGLPTLEKINVAILPDWLLQLRSFSEPFSNVHLMTNNAFYSSANDEFNWGGNYIILAPFTEDFYSQVGNIHFYENEGVINHEYGHHVLAVVIGSKAPLNYKFQGVIRDRKKGNFTGLNTPPLESRSHELTEIQELPLLGAQKSTLQTRTYGAMHEGFADLLSFYSLNRNSLPFKDSLGKSRQPDVSVFGSGVAKNITLNCRESFEKSSFTSNATSCEARELRPYGDAGRNFDLDTHTYGAVFAATVYETYEALKSNANFTDGSAPLSDGGEIEQLLVGARDYAASLPSSDKEFYLGDFYYYLIKFAIDDGLNATGKSAVCTILDNRMSYLTVSTFSSVVTNEQDRVDVATLLTALDGCP